MATETITSTEFQRNFGASIDTVRHTSKTLVVTSHERPQYVVMPIGRYDELQKKERELTVVRLAKIEADRKIENSE